MIEIVFLSTIISGARICPPFLKSSTDLPVRRARRVVSARHSDAIRPNDSGQERGLSQDLFIV